MEIGQYDVFVVGLDPTIGHEIKKSRPCIILSPDEMNKYISTVIIAPLTTKSRPYPTRVQIEFRKKTSWVVLDQIRTVDKRRLIKRLGKITPDKIGLIKSIIKEMLVD